MHLQKLMNIIVAEGKSEPFTCIKDLVENGLSVNRFAEGGQRPSRQEITLFLAAWCKRMGFTTEVYRDWLIDYAVDVLSGISSSSLSQIRHNTKSIIKYLQRSDVAFSCNCQNNIFKAICSLDCPIYGEMEKIYLRNLDVEQKRIGELQQIKEEYDPDPGSLPVTKRYKKQFEEAVALIKQYLKEGHTKKEIAVFLNEKGYKTSTGYDWNPGTVSRIAVMKGLTGKRKKQGEREAVPAQLVLF